jgi:hypothetical protein
MWSFIQSKSDPKKLVFQRQSDLKAIQLQNCTFSQAYNRATSIRYESYV